MTSLDGSAPSALLSIAQAADGGPTGAAGLGLLALGAIATAVVLWVSRARRGARDAAFAHVKDCASDDLAALDDELHAAREALAGSGPPVGALEDVELAADAYDRAERAWKAAYAPEELEHVSAALEEARWALACAQARLVYEDPPLRRPPCFFHPAHGPSARDVEWDPPYGPARMVPACHYDAARVERGERPGIRLVPAAGGSVPYFNAPAHAGYACGFFGGRDGRLLPEILHGSPLGAALATLAGRGRRGGTDAGSGRPDAASGSDAGGLTADPGSGDS